MKENNEVNIYKLKLNETVELWAGAITYFVTRVPGGWIYNNMRLDHGQMNSVFVPFDNEYQQTNGRMLTDKQ